MLEGEGRSEAREIPATLPGSLTARLDRLGPAKEVAQVAAVIGGEFSYDVIRAVSPTGETELQSALEKLADAELIYARGIPPEASYQFKHALIQDAASEALLKSRRRELHRQVALVMTEKFPAVADTRRRFSHVTGPTLLKSSPRSPHGERPATLLFCTTRARKRKCRSGMRST